LLPKEIRRKEATEIRRNAILQAARCVFARTGFAETNVDEIAAKAGVAKGTIYLYFASKEQIYMAALLEDCRRLDAITRQRMDAEHCWQGKLRAYVDVRLSYLDLHHEFLRIYLSEIRSSMLRGMPVDCELIHFVRESEGQLAQVFAAAVATGEIRRIDPELAALTVVELTRGLMERRLLGWCGTETGKDTQFMLDLLNHALARPQP
jgi:AcrR family transcriptional regulator